MLYTSLIAPFLSPNWQSPSFVTQLKTIQWTRRLWFLLYLSLCPRWLEYLARLLWFWSPIVRLLPVVVVWLPQSFFCHGTRVSLFRPFCRCECVGIYKMTKKEKRLLFTSSCQVTSICFKDRYSACQWNDRQAMGEGIKSRAGWRNETRVSRISIFRIKVLLLNSLPMVEIFRRM